ncbi:RNA polymerase sigma-70 factor, ECF subfamily [Bacteroidales bacterium WCE2004]|nr:RNA polymerase sigma-70 factor, ECF subfamily [Bacteroidales bacterium WCE2004]
MTRDEFIGLASAEQESLRRFLLSLCNDAALADDIAQDALVNAYVASSSFRGAARFSTWLFRIAYNCFIDRMRGRRLQTAPLDSPAARAVPGPEAADGRFRHEDLHRAIGMLPDKERAALLLFYMEDKPVKEVADILEMPAGSVRAYLTRGRQHIKDYLEKWKTR